jgi:hypothetical protein
MQQIYFQGVKRCTQRISFAFVYNDSDYLATLGRAPIAAATSFW